MTSKLDRRLQAETAARFNRARSKGRSQPNLLRLMELPAVWCMSIVTERMSEKARIRFKDDLAHFAGTRGLQAYVPGMVACFVPTSGPITSGDRGAILDWLFRHEQVRLVHMRRRPRAKGEILLTQLCDASSEDDDASEIDMGGIPKATEAWFPDEDFSQEPMACADEVSQVIDSGSDAERSNCRGKRTGMRRNRSNPGTGAPRQVFLAKDVRHGR